MVAVLLGKTVVIGHNQVAVNLDDGAFLGKVKRDDGDIFETDVLPDVQLRPVGEREDADAFPLMNTGVVDIPQLRALVLGVPLVEFVAEGEDALFGTALFLVAAGATEGSVELILVEGVEQGLRLHQVRVHLTPVSEGTDAGLESLHIRLDDEVPAVLLGVFVAELNHFLKLPLRIDVHQRERDLPRGKGFLRKANHDR